MLSQFFPHTIVPLCFGDYLCSFHMDLGFGLWCATLACVSSKNKIKIGFHWSLLDEGPRLTMPPLKSPPPKKSCWMGHNSHENLTWSLFFTTYLVGGPHGNWPLLIVDKVKWQRRWSLDIQSWKVVCEFFCVSFMSYECHGYHIGYLIDGANKAFSPIKKLHMNQGVRIGNLCLKECFFPPP